MEPNKLLDILHTAERLKDTLRHCDTSKGRRESVAEHSWRLALMAFFLRDEFPDTDMDRVIRMCLIHDLGECFTGDIPSFNKTAADEEQEDRLLHRWVDSLPAPYAREMHELYRRGYTPKVKPTKSCNACSLKELCLPKLMKSRSVSDYLRAAMEEMP